jgi:hypothetical protein
MQFDKLPLQQGSMCAYMQFENLPLQPGSAKLSGRRPVALLAGLQHGG